MRIAEMMVAVFIAGIFAGIFLGVLLTSIIRIGDKKDG